MKFKKLSLSHFFQVLGKNGIRGWLDGSAEKMNWLKLVRSTNYTHDVNVQHLLLAGQVWSYIFTSVPVYFNFKGLFLKVFRDRLIGSTYIIHCANLYLSLTFCLIYLSNYNGYKSVSRYYVITRVYLTINDNYAWLYFQS